MIGRQFVSRFKFTLHNSEGLKDKGNVNGSKTIIGQILMVQTLIFLLKFQKVGLDIC
jgi:hypothetical protein